MRTRLWALVAALPLLLFLVQWPLVWMRLDSLGCQVAELSVEHRSCESGACHEKYRFTPAKPYLLLGHVIRSHRVYNSATQAEIFPASAIRTLRQETWPDLFVYEVKPGVALSLDVEYPVSAKLKGFAGLRPRICANSNVLAVPSIPDTFGQITHILMGVFLVVTLLAASRGNSPSISGAFGDHRGFLIGSVGFYFVGYLGTTHYFDVFMPSASAAKLVLRCLAIFGALLPILGSIPRRGYAWFATAMVAAIVLSGVGASVPEKYLLIVLAAHLISAFALLLSKSPWIGVPYLGMCVELVARALGLRPGEVPPVNAHLLTLGIYALWLGWRQGAGIVLPRIRHVYENILREVHFIKLSSALSAEPKGKISENSDPIQEALKHIPGAAGAGRVGVLLMMPGSQAVTYSFDSKSGQFRKFDDGKVQGAIFTRVLLYRESLWFATVEGLIRDGFSGLKGESELNDASMFCAIPLTQRDQVIGAIALTRFDDDQLKGRDGEVFRDELRTRISVIARQLEAFLHTEILSNEQDQQELEQRLITSAENAGMGSTGKSEFLAAFCNLLVRTTGCSVLIFEKSSESAAALIQASGLSEVELIAWKARPLNIDRGKGNRIGPFIVAFNEHKSSFIRDVCEIYGQFHPYSVQLFDQMQAGSLVAVPFFDEKHEFVLALISRRQNEPLQLSWLNILERLHFVFLANLRAIEQQSAASALGRLMIRFVNDEEMRTKLLEIATEREPPSTIGRVQRGLLLVPDIIGSTALAHLDHVTKARYAGTFYNDVQRAAFETLGAVPRKSLGDSLILAAEVPPGQTQTFSINAIVAFAEACEEAAKRLGYSGARLCLHYGEYFCGLVGTQSFAQIDVIGTEIDRVCKLEGIVKEWKPKGIYARIAFTSVALERVEECKSLCDQAPTGTDQFVGDYFLFEKATDAAKLRMVSAPAEVVKKAG